MKLRVHLNVIFILFLLIGWNPVLRAQNMGLGEKQDPATLPRSATPVQQAVARKKGIVHTILRRSGDDYLLSGGWELQAASLVNGDGTLITQSSFKTSNWYKATVPGTVLTTLVDQGVYPDPYFGLNNLSIPDTLCRQAWWYRTSFRLPPDRKKERVRLRFDGINYIAQVWLNGRMLGVIKGAFCRGDFDISESVDRNKNNFLAVYIFPPPHPGIPHEESSTAGTGPNGGQLCLDGPTFISSEGWDWIPGIRDRDIGIWQEVGLHFSGAISLSDPQVITDLPLPDTSSAFITVKTIAHNSGTHAELANIKGRIGAVSFMQKVLLQPGEQKTIVFDPKRFSQLHIKNPGLWWPNGYGHPTLHELQLTAVDEEGLADTQTVSFGIRELSYELSVDAPQKKDWHIEFNPTAVFSRTALPVFDNTKRRKVTGETFIPSITPGTDTTVFTSLPDASPYLVIKVNGRRIFCRGGNWGMDDGMKRVSREKLEPYFRLHREAHFNMVRNWTGENTEEIFYRLCDEYGLLVWNDFWMSTEGYNVEPEDAALFLDNARDVIRRFRNHPCIALWCPRNEGYAPAALEDSLAALVVREDGTRHYQPNSRYLNLRTSGPWHYISDARTYFTGIADGFNTEIGTPSVPTARAIRSMMPSTDTWPISDTWYYHDLHKGQIEYKRAIDSLYGPAASLDEFCKKAQLINYDSHRAIFEAYNNRLWNHSSGVLLWMTHPAWPSTVWQAYSSDYETFGSYYGLKKASEPVHIQMSPVDNSVSVISIVPYELERANASLTIYDEKGQAIYNKHVEIRVGADGLTSCFVPGLPASLPQAYLCRLTLTDAQGKLLSQNDYWRCSHDFLSFNNLPEADVKAELLSKHENYIDISVTNTSTTVAVNMSLHLLDRKGNSVLPAYYSDDYFNLLPGESRKIRIETNRNADVSTIMAEGYNRPLTDK